MSKQAPSVGLGLAAHGDEVAARPLRQLVPGYQRPEARPVAAVAQVGQLVHQYIVDHPDGKVSHPGAQTDCPAVDRAAAPSATLVIRPTDGRGAELTREMTSGQRLRAWHQVVVAGRRTPLQPPRHALDPFLFFGGCQTKRKSDLD